ncbi:PQQ-binding-like beta-propeller repeat protein [Maribellus comscasis]|uniref:PQQ-binding-like beta-propeller repeat protein n=1 Tax=Maribellus comscasis TaxID=2681766 RepID=A0A6I6K0G4_9BACT|nr:PQQ-binding-like beta-propeller repeat protein [Maribellus comscasis]QGY47079.1 PQQ-binding-like beta-propeller repeat protein [Maribellus comscasis]
MTRVFFFIIGFVFVFSACSEKKTQFSQWRGPNRDGIYQETGLLKKWPENGPELLWSVEGLGYGHSSVAIAGDNIFVSGMKDTIDSNGTLYSFDKNGNLLWKKEYGPDYNAMFHGPRSTPTIVNDLMYFESGMGKVYCFNTENGDEVWSVDFIDDLGVDSIIQFGYSESVLIDGDRLICVPGGKENNVVALNRFTGEEIWSSTGNGEQATYNSPILINYNNQRLVIGMTSESVMGIDADTGEMYWRIEHTQGNKIHANTPVYSDGRILVATPDRGDTSGMILIQLSEDGKDAAILWRNERLRSFMGGLIKLDTCIYASGYLRNDWQVLSWNTGEMIVQNKDLGGGAIIYADEMFYGYAERDGEMALMKANPEKIEIVNRFEIPMGTMEHWAHPVINDGRLYVRHGDALMVYNIKEA